MSGVRESGWCVVSIITIIPPVFTGVKVNFHRKIRKDVIYVSMKELRERRGLTQAQVADRLDVDRSTVTKWELTGNVPLRKYRRKLCELLGCTEAELLANAAS